MSLLLFLIVLTGLVLIHEAGHFFVAKWAGVKPEEFGVGFPPRAIGWTRKSGKWVRVKKEEVSVPGTIWSLNWLPLGGFVRLKGEQGEDVESAGSFQRASLKKRLLIIAAGVIMNWLLAAAIFTAGYAVGIPMAREVVPQGAIVRDARFEVSSLLPGGPAEQAGIRLGDALLTIDGTVVAQDSATLVREIQAKSSQNERISLQIRRGESVPEVIQVQPRELSELGRKGIGIAFEERVIARLPLWRAPLEGIRTTALFTWAIVTGLWQLVVNLVTSGSPGAEVSGPVGIAVMTGQVAQEGVWALMRFAAILSLNLAVVNFLPIPALDGGRALFIFAEAVRGKKVRAQLEAAIHGIGFLVLIVLILLVTFNDLRQHGGFLWKSFLSLLTQQTV